MLSETVRIRFRKVGRIKYISHLDMQRTFITGLVRSGLPIWYSKGFNPHPKLVFALTVSVGSESLCEFLDVRLDGEVDEKYALERLRASFTDEMKIEEVYSPERKFSEIEWSSYSIGFEGSLDQNTIDSFLSGDIFVTKRTKSGEKTENIRPLIKSAIINGNTIETVLAAKGEIYLNPEYFMKGLNEFTNNSVSDYSIKRTRTLDSSMNDFR